SFLDLLIIRSLFGKARKPHPDSCEDRFFKMNGLSIQESSWSEHLDRNRYSQPRTSRSHRPLVSIVVVNYNGGALLNDCLKALLESSYPARELIVVDNASTDDSPRAIRDLVTAHPEINALWSDSNLGYAGGVNLAVAASGGPYVAVM